MTTWTTAPQQSRQRALIRQLTFVSRGDSEAGCELTIGLVFCWSENCDGTREVEGAEKKWWAEMRLNQTDKGRRGRRRCPLRERGQQQQRSPGLPYHGLLPGWRETPLSVYFAFWVCAGNSDRSRVPWMNEICSSVRECWTKSSVATQGYPVQHPHPVLQISSHVIRYLLQYIFHIMERGHIEFKIECTSLVLQCFGEIFALWHHILCPMLWAPISNTICIDNC